MISVLLTTYNGSRFIEEQLLSIYNQTKQPDEVLILDDCSSDEGKTVAIIDDFIKKHELQNWKLIVNEKNLGWRNNFHKGLSLVQGDLCFLSDQDDIWKDSKIAEMVAIMDNRPDINVLACDYEILNLRNTAIQTNKTQDINNDGTLVQVQFNRMFHLVGRPGCCYCVRMSFEKSIEKVWIKDYAHDKIIWIAGQIDGSLWIYHKNLIQFRRHDSNSSGNGAVLSREHKFNLQQKDMALVDMLCATFNVTDNHKLHIIKEHNEWSKARLTMLKYRGYRLWINIAIKYRHFYSSNKSLAGDFLSILFEKYQ